MSEMGDANGGSMAQKILREGRAGGTANLVLTAILGIATFLVRDKVASMDSGQQLLAKEQSLTKDAVTRLQVTTEGLRSEMARLDATTESLRDKGPDPQLLDRMHRAEERLNRIENIISRPSIGGSDR